MVKRKCVVEGCTQTCHSAAALALHLEVAHGLNPKEHLGRTARTLIRHMCPVCSYISYDPALYQRHLEDHTLAQLNTRRDALLPICCRKCRMIIVAQNVRLYHERSCDAVSTGRGLKKRTADLFKCRNCGHSFRAVRQLLTHAKLCGRAEAAAGSHGGHASVFDDLSMEKQLGGLEEYGAHGMDAGYLGVDGQGNKDFELSSNPSLANAVNRIRVKMELCCKATKTADHESILLSRLNQIEQVVTDLTKIFQDDTQAQGLGVNPTARRTQRSAAGATGSNYSNLMMKKAKK
ncbi:uncharacterized protein MONBRDRAFT_29629 [Monosiga brevicollis MX1]|uniref:C2H2-type domain-containing protein n=1 Tax=Monosiga brevicollis TaxID=81824 RepID=A9VBN6_MONBE|nr:uncharacterized protein MONBRDRAFT_29629 [Monosiga brevicollis MX1]EDQ85130.1 predicted protein [Monosiga brevicollis MX1]|eukprot:XP_001750134.1 hypothetical protein [Monosiga brevicollis MX1]